MTTQKRDFKLFGGCWRSVSSTFHSPKRKLQSRHSWTIAALLKGNARPRAQSWAPCPKYFSSASQLLLRSPEVLKFHLFKCKYFVCFIFLYRLEFALPSKWAWIGHVRMINPLENTVFLLSQFLM